MRLFVIIAYNFCIYQHTGIFKFLDEYYDSLRREAQLEEEKQKAASGGGDGGGDVEDLSQNQASMEENEGYK